MFIEDWCVGEALGDPRMAKARALRAHFHDVTMDKWRERQRIRRLKSLPLGPNDRPPRLAPQAQVLEMRLDGGQRVKKMVHGISRLDAGQRMAKGVVHGLSKLDPSRMMQNMAQDAPGSVRNAALAIAGGVNGRRSSWKMPAFSLARAGSGGGLPLRIPV